MPEKCCGSNYSENKHQELCDSLVSGWFLHLKDQAAEMKVIMSEWKLISVLIMMETGISVPPGELQLFCLDLLWVLSGWQKNCNTSQSTIGWTLKKELSQIPEAETHNYVGMWIAFFNIWNTPERPWVPAFCYVMTEQPTDAGVREVANILAADGLIKMVSA